MKKEVFYVIGVFDCGCKHESNLSSIEIVSCKNEIERDTIIQLMKARSAAHQCEKTGAVNIICINGSLLTATEQIDLITDYDGYNKKWAKKQEYTLENWND